ncbi:MAG: hypothetical protein IKA89_05295, partial [Anaerotignum sp.]|nr:hypothetical protein [Anaerotignum sp.]
MTKTTAAQQAAKYGTSGTTGSGTKTTTSSYAPQPTVTPTAQKMQTNYVPTVTPSYTQQDY